jgi:hypothetical protein
MMLVLVCRVFFQCTHMFESPTEYSEFAYHKCWGVAIMPRFRFQPLELDEVVSNEASAAHHDI